MKVLIIGPAYPYRGGIADTNEALCRSFLKGGIEANIVTFTLQYPSFLFPGKTQFTNDPEPGDMDIRRMVNSVNPWSWYRTAQYINRSDFDLVLIRYWIPFMALSLGTINRWIKSPCRKIAICDNIIPHEKRIGDKWLTRYFVESCDAFVTLSETVKDELTSFSDKRTICLPHPINEQLEPGIERREARKKLNLSLDKNYVLFFGLVRAYKGLDLLLRAFGYLDLDKLGVELLVVGEFYSDKEHYLGLIADLGIEDKVTIVDSFIPSADLKYYFSAVDMVAQTYKTASQSGVTQLAYFYDRPMLVTDVGGLSETVPDRKVGYVTTRDPETISACLADFFLENRFQEYSEQVHEEKKKYSWDKFRDNIIDLYHTLS